MTQGKQQLKDRRWMGVAAAVALAPLIGAGTARAADESVARPDAALDVDDIGTQAAHKCTTGVFSYTCIDIADRSQSSGGVTYRKLTTLQSRRNLNGPNQSTCNYKAEMQIRPPGLPSSQWKTYYTGVQSGCVSTGLDPMSSTSAVLSWAGNSDVMGPLWKSGTEFCTRWWQDGNATQNYACADVHN